MARYPDRKSASIPALWAVQERYGWCTPEGIRQAAAVMRVTPAYLESVASFYDLLHTEPVGSHRIEVCTNISCWMRGGDELLDAFVAAAAGDDDLFVTGFECLGACDIAPMASIDQRYYGPLEAAEAGARSTQLKAGETVLPEKELAKRPRPGREDLLMAHELRDARPARARRGPGAAHARRLQAAGRRLRDPGEGLPRAGAGRGPEGARRLGPARARRRRLLDGQKGLLPAARRDGQVPLLQRRRVRARAPSRTAS